MAIPDDGRFALVGNTDGGDIGATKVGAGKASADDLLGTLPDFLGVMLDPAWSRGIFECCRVGLRR
jgi:hypothetical protein